MGRIAHGNDIRRTKFVLVDVVAMGMMEMRVMDVVDMIVVMHREMTARFAMDVLVAIVNVRFQACPFRS